MSLVFLLMGAAYAADVSPVEKVVTMLEDLQTQIVVEGKAEAKTYDKFACFCKDMTAEKTDAISAGTDKSADLSALIEQLTNDRSTADDDINDLNKKIDDLDKSMKENKEKRAGEKATFDALHAELSKGITDLTNAVGTLKSSRPASLMSLKSVIKTIRQAAFMGDAMGHSPKNQMALAALLQQPEVPTQDFTFHSEEIISMIEGLQSDFKTKLSEVRIEETKKVSAFDLQMQADTDERAAAAKELKHKVRDRFGLLDFDFGELCLEVTLKTFNHRDDLLGVESEVLHGHLRVLLQKS
jgi:chromosome segregation ATPase